MSQRLDYFKLSPQASNKLIELSMLLSSKTPFLADLARLITLRASQMNGCAFCVDMHVKEAKIHGERELRLHHVAVWRESTLFSPRERAALEWTEALHRDLAQILIGDSVLSETFAHGCPRTSGSIDRALASEYCMRIQL